MKLFRMLSGVTLFLAYLCVRSRTSLARLLLVNADPSRRKKSVRGSPFCLLINCQRWARYSWSKGTTWQIRNPYAPIPHFSSKLNCHRRTFYSFSRASIAAGVNARKARSLGAGILRRFFDGPLIRHSLIREKSHASIMATFIRS